MIFEKDPDEILDYKWDWSDFLGTDSIIQSTFTVPDGLTYNSDSLLGGDGFPVTGDNPARQVVLWLSDGEIGILYMVTNHIATAEGRTVERSIYIRLVEH